MTAFINPGSRITSNEGNGWTNTYEAALTEAQRWLKDIHNEGMVDVDLLVPVKPREIEGRWVFGFQHRVTGVIVELETHGIDNVEAYGKDYVFAPRVYWNGSSTSNPGLEDWAAPGFVPVQTYRPVASGGDAKEDSRARAAELRGETQ